MKNGKRRRILIPSGALVFLLMGIIACGGSSSPRVSIDFGEPTATRQIIVATFTPLPQQAADTNNNSAQPTEFVVPTVEFIPTVTRTLLPTATAVGGSNALAGPTPSQTPLPFSDGLLPTRTPTPEPTAVPEDDDDTGDGEPGKSGDNLFDNPGFEGGARTVTFGEITVLNDWEPWYCDPPFTDERCDNPIPCEDGQTVGCNPPEVKMRRPEYKVTDLDSRVHSGNTAQQWFCFYGTCQAGVYQRIETDPGDRCVVGAFIQSWSNTGDGDIESDIDTDDGKNNSQWRIRVDLEGGTDPFDGDFVESGRVGGQTAHYDKYVEISMTFTAEDDRTTVYFENLRLFPIVNNDSYIDDAYAYCN